MIENNESLRKKPTVEKINKTVILVYDDMWAEATVVLEPKKEKEND